MTHTSGRGSYSAICWPQHWDTERADMLAAMGLRPASWRWIAQSWRWLAQSRPTRSFAKLARSFAEKPIKPLGLGTNSGLSAASKRRIQALGGTARMSSPRNSAPTPRNSASALIVLLPAALPDRESERTRSQQITRQEPRPLLRSASTPFTCQNKGMDGGPSPPSRARSPTMTGRRRYRPVNIQGRWYHSGLIIFAERS
jgi:hypothetical protein